MDTTTQISILIADQAEKDLLIAQLADLGFDAFEETEEGLHAFIASADFDEACFKNLVV